MLQEKRWIYLHEQWTREQIDALAGELSLPRVIAVLLLNRGLNNEKNIRAFLSKSMKNIRHPLTLPDMDKAVSRIQHAIDKHEKIVVYGDYDVDGVTAAAVVYLFLKSLGADISYYIPERANEGYGVNIVAINQFIKQGVKLIITVDCGITAFGEADFAMLSGVDMVITDHHTCQPQLPHAAAVVNPKREDSAYGFSSLAGVGVAFKLIMALGLAYGQSAANIFEQYVELAALGTVADVMPLTDENRVIVDRGLKKLPHTHYAGIKALLEVSGARAPYNTSTIGFSLAPRINAAGRLSSAQTAVKLLLSQEESAAYQLARELDDDNRHRQLEETTVLTQTIKMIEDDQHFAERRVIVLAHEDWHAGVIGIVASRLQKLYYKPCILISCTDGMGKGSGRSIEGFDLYDALTACKDLLAEFGGHTMAAGLNIREEDISAFDKKINQYAQTVLKDEDFIPKVQIDCPLLPAYVTLKNAKLLSMLEPFGEDNPQPVFSLSSMRIDSVTTMGIDNKHLKLFLSQGLRRIAAVGFSMGEYAAQLGAGDVVDIAFCMDVNTFQGQESVQLLLKDIKKGGE